MIRCTEEQVRKAVRAVLSDYRIKVVNHTDAPVVDDPREAIADRIVRQLQAVGTGGQPDVQRTVDEHAHRLNDLDRRIENVAAKRTDDAMFALKLAERLRGLERQFEAHEETLQFVLGELHGLEGRLEAVEERLGEKPELYKTPAWMDEEGPRPPSYEEFMGHVTERLSALAKRINEIGRLV